MNLRGWVWAACWLLSAGTAWAQAADPEPVAVVELGGYAGWNLAGGALSRGPTAAVEVTPVEDWLELEAGVTPVFGGPVTEWDTDLLFKKPWTLSEKAEFMFGAGPEWVHTRENGAGVNSLSGEVVLDFMFWPGREHRFGWYLEPAFDYGFARGHERSIGISAGLLIGVPRFWRRNASAPHGSQ